MPILEILVDAEDDQIYNYYKGLEENQKLIARNDSGIDLVTTEEITIKPYSIGTLDFKIKCQMKDDDGSYLGYYLYPRSSISKTPLLMANSVGIIDSGYRGNIMAKVRNIPIEENKNYHVEKGSRLFQICSPDLKPIRVKIVKTLSETERGEGGFGSTGLKLET